MPALILVVDDEPKITELARLYLDNEGYRVSAVHDGEQALQAFRAQQPGLIVLEKQVSNLIDNAIPPRVNRACLNGFYRVDTARAAGGSGLGLAIVQEIVRAHHGFIEITSEENVGTTCSVWLPAQA